MDPLEPIAGISLEKYAELCAKMSTSTTDEEFSRIAGENGVDAATWQSAREGWNARMYDPATAGTVVMAYHPLYQQAMSQFAPPPPEVDFDQYVRMYAMAVTPSHGEQKMYDTFNVTPAQWSQIATHWVGRLTTDNELASKFKDAAPAEIAKLG